MLLKPWREIKIDLKKSTQSWEVAYEEFLETALAKTKDILSGIQYYYQRHSSAMRQAQESAASNAKQWTSWRPRAKTTHLYRLLTEERLRALQASHEPIMEDLHVFTTRESARVQGDRYRALD